jgi:hypothetical protein
MDHNDREQFWKTLCSLPGNDIVAEREQLFKSIKYPKLLFRYRPVSTKSLEALRTNRLYFSSANYYDDPFDTFLHIDIEAIRKEYLSAFQTPESTEAVVDGVKSLLGIHSIITGGFIMQPVIIRHSSSYLWHSFLIRVVLSCSHKALPIPAYSSGGI